MAYLVWQQTQISDSPDRYQEVEETALVQRKQMHRLLVSFNDRWEAILNQLEQVDFTLSKLFA